MGKIQGKFSLRGLCHPSYYLTTILPFYGGEYTVTYYLTTLLLQVVLTEWSYIVPQVRTSCRDDCVHAGLARGTCLLSAGQARTAICDFLPVRQTKECSPALAVAGINPAFSVHEAWTFGSITGICITDDGLGTCGVLRSRTESSEKRYREEHDGLH